MDSHRAVVFIIVAILAVSGIIALTYNGNFGTLSSSSPTRRLGFWVDARTIGWGSTCSQTYTPSQFVNDYFLSIPYPSAMVFAFSTSFTGPCWSDMMNWLTQVMQLIQQDNLNVAIQGLWFPTAQSGTGSLCTVSPCTGAYPCAWNGDGSVDSQAAVNFITGMISTLSKYPQWVGMQYEPEYCPTTTQTMTNFNSLVTSNGMINFVGQSGWLSTFPNAQILGYCEFPWFSSSDSAESCITGSASTGFVGNSFGEETHNNISPTYPSGQANDFPAACVYPSVITTPPNPACNGWDQQNTQMVVDDSLKVPASYRQWVIYDVGGVDPYGSISLEINDNQYANLFHSWIWNDPNYVGNYVLSNSAFTTAPHTTYTTQTHTTQTQTCTGSLCASTITSETTTTTGPVPVPEGYCLQNATYDCSSQQLTEHVTYPSGTYEIRYHPQYCYPIQTLSVIPSCLVPVEEPAQLANQNWASVNETIDAPQVSGQISLGNNTIIQGINSSVPITNVLYSNSIIQVVFPANVTVFLQIRSTRAPTSVYADGRPVSWTYSGGVVSIAADPNTITMMFGSSSSSPWLAFIMQYEAEIILGLVVLVAIVAIVVSRRR